MGTAPSQVPLDGTYDQEAGPLARIDMKSAVKNSDSATFSSKQNFRLPAGTLLQLGVGSASSMGSAATAAE